MYFLKRQRGSEMLKNFDRFIQFHPFIKKILERQYILHGTKRKRSWNSSWLIWSDINCLKWDLTIPIWFFWVISSRGISLDLLHCCLFDLLDPPFALPRSFPFAMTTVHSAAVAPHTKHHGVPLSLIITWAKMRDLGKNAFFKRGIFKTIIIAYHQA